MQRRLLGALRAEVIEAESAKFTAPMVLLPGLWSQAPIWRRFMGYLSHRGWQCFAFERSETALSTFDDLVVPVRRAIATLEAPPVIVGHDLGALVALEVAGEARAVAALAPIVPPSIGGAASTVLRRAGTWMQRRLERPLSAPRVYAQATAASPGLESPALVRALADAAWQIPPRPASVPSLVWVATDDEVTSVDSARALATHVGAEFRTSTEGGHDLPGGPGWERRVSELHRWIVRQAGRSLLAYYDDEDRDV